MTDEPLDRCWFARHPVEVAFGLIGCWFHVLRDGQQVQARIVETEAYGGMEDEASHATMYRVGRESLAQDAGQLYMQFAYGMHTMTNVVAHRPGQLGAVLLRAVEDPTVGLELVTARFPAKVDRFMSGPGNVSKGMGTMLSDTLYSVTHGPPIWISAGAPPSVILASPRIGISKAIDARWRFFNPDSRSVSRHRRGDEAHVGDLEHIIEDL